MKVFCLYFLALFVYSSGNPIGDRTEKGKHDCDFWEPESKSIRIDKLVDCLFVNYENQTDPMNLTSGFKHVLKNMIDSLENVTGIVCNGSQISENIEKIIDASNIPDVGKHCIMAILEYVKKTCTLYETLNKKDYYNLIMETKRIITERMISMMTNEGKSAERNKREVAPPLIPIQYRLFIFTVFDFVKETIKEQYKILPMVLENKGGKNMTSISNLNISRFVKEDVLSYIWEMKKSKMEAENLILDCNKNITNKQIPSIIYLSINDVFGESAFLTVGYNDSVETNLLGWMTGQNDLNDNTVKVILKIHDFLYNFVGKFNLGVFLDELENIYLKSLNENKSVCLAYKTIKESLHSILDPILQNSTEKAIGHEIVSEIEKRGRIEALPLFEKLRENHSMTLRIKRNTEQNGSVSWKPLTNKEWNAKKEEFFKKYTTLDVEVSDMNSTGVKENIEGILEGFSIESGEGDRPTMLKMSKKWKPVAERIKRASGENQTSPLTGSMDEEDEERLSLSQDEKILLEEALDHIISSIINHRNDMMSKTRKFISLVVHILAKSDQMEPESLSCIARAGVTFMAETRKHLNTVFKGFRTELETMKKNLWSEDSVDGSDKDETITKLISTELMRDVADAIAASTRTYEVNKVRLFEKFMVCKEKNSA